MTDKKASFLYDSLRLIPLVMLLNLFTFTDPPYWDGLVGVFHQGSWLAENNLDYVALAQEKSYADGGPRLQIENAVALTFALSQMLVGPQASFIVLHILSTIFAALALTCLLALLSEHMPRGLAWIWTLAAGATPVFSAQTATIYLEIPMALAAMAMLFFVQRERFLLAAAICATSWFVKPTAVVLALALAVCSVGSLALDAVQRRPSSPGIRYGLIPAIFLLMIFVFRQPESIRSQISLSQRFVFWLIQVFLTAPFDLLMLLLTMALALWVLLSKRRRLEFFREPRRLKLIFAFATLSWGYWLSHSIHELPLTRYLAVVTLPLTGLFALALSLVAPVTLQRLFALLWLCLCLGNQWGHLLPALSANLARSGDRLERSREFLEDLQQNRRLCQFLEENYFDSEIIAQPPFVQMLTEPALGYVSRPLPRVLSVAYPCDGKSAKFLSAEEFPERLAAGALVIYAANGYSLNPNPRLAPSGPVEVLHRQDLQFSPLLLYRKASREKLGK